jgi:hypothetical protein
VLAGHSVGAETLLGCSERGFVKASLKRMTDGKRFKGIGHKTTVELTESGILYFDKSRVKS